MSRSSSQTVQSSLTYAPVGFIGKMHSFVVGMVRFEPAANAIYAENARVRMSGRTWLM
ncbi:MAG: hypothetical protein WCE69_06655 [Aestuariivirga sp.]